MSKFFLTNNSSLYQAIKGRVETSSYKIAFEYNKDNIFVLTTKKLTVDNINGIKCDDGFVIVTGTMAWGNGEPINTTTLKEIYQQFDSNINNIRKNAIGNYAICVFKDGVLNVFGELAGFYNVFYYHQDNEWFVSNSLYDMSIVLKNVINVDVLNVIESTVQEGIMWGGTYFKEIKRLIGFDHLKLSKLNCERIVEHHNYPLAESSIEEQVARYKELSVSFAKKMTNAYGNPTISMTGGLDARMVLAANLAACKKPDIYYGTGDSFITNTFEQDKEIDKIYCSKFGLKMFDVSWATPIPVDKYWDKYLKEYGYLYEIYAAADSVFDSIKNTSNQLFLHGQAGELLRNLPWIEKKERDYFTLEEYIHELYVPESQKCFITNTDEYLNHIRTKLEEICKYYHLDVNHIPNEDVFFLSLERRKSADALFVNFVNLLKYCSYQLVENENMKAARVNCKEMADSRFMLRCIDAIYPELLDVPVFSHCMMREFYRDTMSLNPQNRPISKFEQIKAFLRHNVHWLWEIARKIFPVKKWRFQKDETIINRICYLFDKYDSFNVIDPQKIDDARHLVKYVMKLYALKNIT